eukprot:1755597-Prymnesium_polylepis.2
MQVLGVVLFRSRYEELKVEACGRAIHEHPKAVVLQGCDAGPPKAHLCRRQPQPGHTGIALNAAAAFDDRACVQDAHGSGRGARVRPDRNARKRHRPPLEFLSATAGIAWRSCSLGARADRQGIERRGGPVGPRRIRYATVRKEGSDAVATPAFEHLRIVCDIRGITLEA